jgi:hypothetical protein
MVQSNGFEIMKRFAAAARQVMEDGLVNADEGRFSRTVFMAGGSPDGDIVRVGIEAAIAQGLGIVMLEFGTTGVLRGPRRFSAAIRGEDGQPRLFRDCALVDDGGERLVLVPRGEGGGGHLAVGERGLEHRPGRPSSLAGGMARAARRLTAAARSLTDVGPVLEIHQGRKAA